MGSFRFGRGQRLVKLLSAKNKGIACTDGTERERGEGGCTHAVPARFYLDVSFLSEELATGSSLREEGVNNCNHGVSVYVPHGKGVVKQMGTKEIKPTGRSMISSVRM